MKEQFVASVEAVWESFLEELVTELTKKMNKVTELGSTLAQYFFSVSRAPSEI